uniref:Uncharacterized protein n=1 Tax=Anguilla anguilla TaxID=7936 RepID=A0A0E9RRB7_ANGAN
MFYIYFSMWALTVLTYTQVGLELQKVENPCVTRYTLLWWKMEGSISMQGNSLSRFPFLS